jgi:tRNA(fMet)-specific endonuclease VapC
VTEAIIDTDILSFYFKGDKTVIQQFGEYLKEFDQVNISIVTYFESLQDLSSKRRVGSLRNLKISSMIITLSTYLKSRLKYRETFTLI